MLEVNQSDSRPSCGPPATLWTLHQTWVASVLEKLYFDTSILVFASHNAELLKSTCERGIIIKGGKIFFDGDINQAIEINHSF